MHFHHKYLILISVFLLTAGMPLSSFGLDNDGEHHTQQPSPGQLHRVEREDHGKEHHEHRDRDRGADSGFGYFGGTPYGSAPYYENNYNYPDNSYNQNSGDLYDVGYSEGFQAGQYDHLNGFLYNPRQYERGGNPDYFEGFVAGYRDGWTR
jgi:hypothetical protein